MFDLCYCYGIMKRCEVDYADHVEKITRMYLRTTKEDKEVLICRFSYGSININAMRRFLCKKD